MSASVAPASNVPLNRIAPPPSLYRSVIFSNRLVPESDISRPSDVANALFLSTGMLTDDKCNQEICAAPAARQDSGLRGGISVWRTAAGRGNPRAQPAGGAARPWKSGRT